MYVEYGFAKPFNYGIRAGDVSTAGIKDLSVYISPNLIQIKQSNPLSEPCICSLP